MPNYTKTNWVNDSTPAINADNLNKIEAGIKANADSINDLIAKSIVIENQTNLTLQSGDFTYRNCSFNAIGTLGTKAAKDTFATITGHQKFYNCTFNTTLIQGSVNSKSTFELYNCTITYFRFANCINNKFINCTGQGISSKGDCTGLHVEGCNLHSLSSEAGGNLRGALILLDGSVNNTNICIRNNTLQNDLSSAESSTTPSIETAQCKGIYIYGASNSIIENNICNVINPSVVTDGSNIYNGDDSIYISGYVDSDTILLNKIIVRNNKANSDIAFFSAKDCVCDGNDCVRIRIGGSFRNLDYGKLDIVNNNAVYIYHSINANTTTFLGYEINIFNNNLTKVPAYTPARIYIAGTAFPANEKMNVANNTVLGNLCADAMITSFTSGSLNLPIIVKWVQPNEYISLPYCFIKRGTFPEATAGSVVAAGSKQNTSTSVQDIWYAQINIVGYSNVGEWTQ